VGSAVPGSRKQPIRLTAAICLLSPALLLFIALLRMRYPFDLSWLEGMVMRMSWRWAQGLPLYTEPSINHVALPYFPLYYVVVGYLYRLTGEAYWVGRLVSLLSTLATGALVYWIVRRETRNRLLSLAGVGMWCASYGFCGYYFDINRIDSLSMVFLLAAYAMALYRTGLWSAALAGVLLAAAGLTKQNLFVFVAPLSFALAMRKDFRRAAALVGALVLVAAPTIWLWNRNSDGWFYRLTSDFVTFTVARSRLFSVPLRILWRFPLPLLVMVFYVLGEIDRRRWRALIADPWLGFWLVALAVSWVFQLPVIGYKNANMPIALATSICACLMFPAVLETKRKDYTWLRKPRRWLLPVAAAVAVFAGSTPGLRQIPRRADWQAAREVRRLVQSTPGIVFIPESLLPEPNVQPFHEMSYSDLRAGAFRPWINKSLQRIRSELAALKPTLVLASMDLANNPLYGKYLTGLSCRPIDAKMKIHTFTGQIFHLSWICTRTGSEKP